jgi:hypothetical protein
MRTDLYTKSLLTVIAGALVILVIQNSRINLFNEAKAGSLNFNAVRSAAGFATLPVNSDGSINVKMTSDMDVNIHSIGGSSVYGTLPINIKEYNGSSMSSNGLPVNIESVDGMSIYSSIPVKEVK